MEFNKMSPQDNLIKVGKYKGIFKGIGHEKFSGHPDEFDYHEDSLNALSLDGALAEWLRLNFDSTISPNVSCIVPAKDINYGSGDLESFLSSKDVFFKEVERSESKLVMQVLFNGRNDFLYEMSIEVA